MPADKAISPSKSSDILKMFGLDNIADILEDESFPEKSFPFDRFLSLKHLGLDLLIERLAQEENSNNDRRARDKTTSNKFHLSTKLIILNLLKVHIARKTLNSSNISVGVEFRSGKYTVKSRYDQASISYRPFIASYEFLRESGYVEIVKNGYYIPEAKFGETTRIGPTSKLSSIFYNLFPDNIVFFTQDPSKEIIELRTARKLGKVVRCEYLDDAFTNIVRDRLSRINSVLENHWYDLNLSNDQFHDFYKEMMIKNDADHYKSFYIDFTRRKLYRAFNNGQFDQGGRFYGGWWQSIPSKYRRFITINGKRTVEVDFSNMQPSLLYAKEGIQLTRDAYTISNLSEVDRDIIKGAFLRMLNGDTDPKEYIPKDYDAEEAGIDWSGLVDAIYNDHAPVARYFSSGIGVELMFAESQMAEQIMLHFTQGNYPCLPIHDSFIVHHGLDDDLKATMQRVYKNYTGMDISVDADMGIDNTIASDELITVEDFISSPLESQYEKRLQAWFNHKEELKSYK